MRCIPKINGVYWLSLAVASLFGANAGGFLVSVVGLDDLRGLPFLAAALALVFFAERVVKQASTLFFWAAVVLIRASATSVSDVIHDSHIRLMSVPVLCLLLAVMVIVWRARQPATEEQGFIPVNVVYWITLFVAGVLGTVGSDAASYPLGFGFLGAMVAFALPLGFLLTIGRYGLYTDLGFYWLVVVLIVAAGTAAGDLLMQALHSIDLGAAISGAAFVALIVVMYEVRKGNRRLDVETVGEGA